MSLKIYDIVIIRSEVPRLKSVILIDDDVDFITDLSILVKSYDELSVVASVHSGHEGVLAIEHYRPDLVIMDIMMPDSDGLSVLKYIRGKCDTYNPFIYVITAMNTPVIKAILSDCKVDFTYFKPIKEEEVVKKTLEKIIVAEQKPVIGNVPSVLSNPVDIVLDVMDEFEIPNHLTGYEYIKATLVFMIDNPSIKRNVYAEVAAIYKSTPRGVAANVNTAIKGCMNSVAYQDEFGHTKAETLLFLNHLSSIVRKRIRGSDKD